MKVTTVSANATNNATIGVQILEGPIPVAGNLITVVGTTQAAGAYNVTNVAISNVVIDATTGIGTITFPLTTAQLAVTADVGAAMVPATAVAEALTNVASQSFAIPQPPGDNSNGKTITWQTIYPNQPATVTMALQAALEDVDSKYQTLDTSTNVLGEMRFITLTDFNFVRVKASGVTGTTPKAIVTIAI